MVQFLSMNNFPLEYLNCSLYSLSNQIENLASFFNFVLKYLELIYYIDRHAINKLKVKENCYNIKIFIKLKINLSLRNISRDFIEYISVLYSFFSTSNLIEYINEFN
jgi:hypothetical protein